MLCQVRLREELRRVVDLMQREVPDSGHGCYERLTADFALKVLPRERQLHDMFENLNSAFHS